MNKSEKNKAQRKSRVSRHPLERHQEENRESHPSYGRVVLSRVTGGPTNLFASSIKHCHTIRLEISRTSKARDLSHDWIYPVGNPLIEIEMSYTQFAEMISSAGLGGGTPCTILYVDNEKMGECPEVDQRQIFDDELDEKVDEISKGCRELVRRADEILSEKRIKVHQKTELRNIYHGLINALQSQMPFVQQSFTEAMDKTVTEAKGEVEAFVLSKVHQLGIKALEDEVRTAIDKSKVLQVTPQETPCIEEET